MSKIKYYASTQANTPTIGNNWGDLTSLLDALLVNGYNLKTVASITRSGSTATATVSAGHSYHVGAIVKVEGVNEAEYNGEVEVLTADSTTFTYEVSGSPASPATGTISAKIAPLGFEIYKTDGAHKRAYRSQDPASSKPVLLVNAGAKGTNPAGNTYTSTWAKWANVGIVEDMTDINTIVGAQAPYDPAYPTRNWDGGGNTNQYGWAKWYWTGSGANAGEASVDSGGARHWALVGDGRSFYLWLGRTGSSGLASYGFGEQKPFKAADGKAQAWLMADSWQVTITAFSSQTIGAYGSFGAAGSGHARGYGGGGATGKWLLNSFDGLNQGQGMSLAGLAGYTGTGVSGGAAFLPLPNGPDYALWLHQPIYTREDTGHIRGVMPGLAHIPHAAPYPDRYIIPASASNGNKNWLVVNSNYSAASNGQNGSGAQVALQISGEWEY